MPGHASIVVVWKALVAYAMSTWKKKGTNSIVVDGSVAAAYAVMFPMRETSNFHDSIPTTVLGERHRRTASTYGAAPHRFVVVVLAVFGRALRQSRFDPIVPSQQACFTEHVRAQGCADGDAMGQ